MPERPLLLLPSPGEPVPRPMGRGGGGVDFPRPTRKRQAERLSPRFVALQEALDKRRAELRMEASDLVPEEVVVLETVGTVDNFIRAVERVPEMEYLAEVEAESIPPDDDYFSVVDDGAEQPTNAVPSRVFMVFTNQSALQQMISLGRSTPRDVRISDAQLVALELHSDTARPRCNYEIRLHKTAGPASPRASVPKSYPPPDDHRQCALRHATVLKSTSTRECNSALFA